MESNKRILEIIQKGPEEANVQDIPLFLESLQEFINTNLEARHLIQEIEFSMLLEIEGAEAYYFRIEEKEASFKEYAGERFDFRIRAKLSIITELLLGQLDMMEAFFAEKFETEGDLYSMICFLEIIEIAFKILDLGMVIERKSLINATDMKELFDVYALGYTVVKPFHIPLLYDVLTAFVNNNKEAQSLIEGEDFLMQFTIKGIGDFLVRIVANKMGWARGSHQDAIVLIKMGLKESAELILTGNALTAFMEGKIIIQGEIVKALIYQGLIELFMQFLRLK